MEKRWKKMKSERQSKMDVGEQLVDRLIGYGVRRVFGCPGGQTLPLYHGLVQRPTEIEHVLVRDERGGIFAADAYARLSGTVGVCDATVGPGATNLVSGLAEALSSSVPVLAIVSDIPRRWEHRRRLGSASQGIEQRKYLEQVVKWYGRVETPENLPDVLDNCLRIATGGRPGPVILEIPDDVFASLAVPATYSAELKLNRYPRLRSAPDPDALAEAVKRLASSKKPIILGGGGALRADAGLAVTRLATILACPVATTVTGKGLISEESDYSVGVSGTFGVPMANLAMGETDCLILVGCKGGQGATLGWTLPDLDIPTIHIDIDTDEIGRSFKQTIGIWADAKLGVNGLCDALEASKAKGNKGWDLGELARRRDEWWNSPPTLKAPREDGVCKPQEVVRAMRAGMADNALLVTDASLSSGWGGAHWKMNQPGILYLAPRGLAGLGWGLPAAIGASLSERDSGKKRRVVCLAGDGGWAYSMSEIETAVRWKLPIVSVLLNNSALGWLDHTGAARYNERVCETFTDVSFAAAAKALGAETSAVNSISEFTAVFEQAMNYEGDLPWVIEVTSCDIETPVLKNMSGNVTTSAY
jgi:acetolactate synthase-1/2/3 large subunit